MRSLVSHPVICRSAQKTLSAKSMQTVALQDDVYALQQPGDLSETFDSSMSTMALSQGRLLVWLYL
jgi:hypothetical protein